MAFRLALPDPFPARGWKAKILRQLAVLCREWDAMYPENPIESKEDDDD
jgi:hypothetical protein